MRLAIQEQCLPGESTLTRAEFARQVGLAGIEYTASSAHERIAEIATTLPNLGLKVAGLHAGGTHLLHPDIAIRDQAIKSLQQAMIDVLDLGAEGVTFYAHQADTPRLPDLHPYKSDIELTAELLVTQLRATLADFALATGASLYLAPQTQAETHLLHRLDMAATILRHNGNHPHVKIAANTRCMLQEEDDVLTALATHAPMLGMVYLCDADGRLPGSGRMDVEAVVKTLRDQGYEGWLIMTGHGEKADIHQAVDNVGKWL